MEKYAREIMAFCIVALFGFALYSNPHDRDLRTAITLALAAYGFYLGGSKSGADTAAKNAETVAAVTRVANDQPQPVTVVNSEAEPVPTVEAQ